MTVCDSQPARIEPCDLLVCCGCALMQLVLGGHVSLFGAAPNFMLAAVYFLAMRHGRSVGAAAGFFCGLLFDLLGSMTVGLSAFVATLFGYLAPVFIKSVGAVGVRSGVLLFAMMSLGFNLVYFTFLLVLGDVPSIGLASLGRVVASVTMDTAAASLVLWGYRKASGSTSGRIKL